MRRRLFIILIAPIEVLACAVVGAWEGAVDGINNVADAWRQPN